MSRFVCTSLFCSLVVLWSLACAGVPEEAPVVEPVPAPVDGAPLKLDGRYFFYYEADDDINTDYDLVVLFSGDGTCKVGDIESTLLCHYQRSGDTLTVTAIDQALGPDGPWSDEELQRAREDLPGPFTVAADGTSMKEVHGVTRVYVLVEDGKNIGIVFHDGGGGGGGDHPGKAKGGKGKGKAKNR